MHFASVAKGENLVFMFQNRAFQLWFSVKLRKVTSALVETLKVPGSAINNSFTNVFRIAFLVALWSSPIQPCCHPSEQLWTWEVTGVEDVNYCQLLEFLQGPLVVRNVSLKKRTRCWDHLSCTIIESSLLKQKEFLIPKQNSKYSLLGVLLIWHCDFSEQSWL